MSRDVIGLKKDEVIKQSKYYLTRHFVVSITGTI